MRGMKLDLARISALCLAIFLAGCAEGMAPAAQNPDGEIGSTTAGTKPPDNASTVEEFDTTTADQRTAALASQTAVTTKIGTTIASLGNPTDAGFWMQTPLVSVRTPGRVVYPVTGTSVAVDLIPIDGPATGGSRISLAAMRLLGAPLTGLPELIVYSR